ncbi:hypothetical protein J2W21_000647 [Sinomonas atrocyanea]|uniref:hypothetical protein n=1 Tax=Sinomonas atrocyanea TaxID=37927 RepID=UPI00277EF0C3|nr:hypothetical protein [Sinomonas atrocyanea]MDP9883157.1 hypothetical protein [Sinomonas atrocyanea]
MPYTMSPLAPRGGERALTIPELADVLGADAFSNPRYHGYGECDEETRRQLQKVRHAPEALVRIYRALPSGLGQINPGDWVTLSQDYARQHAMRDDDAANDWPIVFADVPARTVITDGKDLDQYGYAGPPLTGLRDSAAGDSVAP